MKRIFALAVTAGLSIAAIGTAAAGEVDINVSIGQPHYGSVASYYPQPHYALTYYAPPHQPVYQAYTPPHQPVYQAYTPPHHPVYQAYAPLHLAVSPHQGYRQQFNVHDGRGHGYGGRGHAYRARDH